MKKMIWTSLVAAIVHIQADAMRLPPDFSSENPSRAYTEALRALEGDLVQHAELGDGLI